MKFSRNPVSGQVEIYSDEGVYLGIVSTMGDDIGPETAEDGGPGSGNYGHKGRPGKRGGSGPGGGKQYRGGRSDIGYFSSRKDWLNGLSGEKQHEAARFIATAKKTLESRKAARKEIESLAAKGLLTYPEAEERLKRGKLDQIREDMTPEEYIMKVHPMTSDRKKMVDLMAEARSWPETAKRLMDENLTDQEKKVVQELAKKYGIDPAGEPFLMLPDDKGSIASWSREDAECWLDLKSKALGGPTSGKEIPEELQYASGMKQRPAADPTWPKSRKDNQDWPEKSVDESDQYFRSIQNDLERKFFVSFRNFAGNWNMNEAETDIIRRLQSAYGNSGSDKIWTVGKYLRKKDEAMNGGKEAFFKTAQSALENGHGVGSLKPEHSAAMCGLLQDMVDQSNEINKTNNNVGQIGDIIEGDFLRDKEVPIDVKAAYLGLKAFSMGTPDPNNDGEHYAKKLQEYRVKRQEAIKQQKAVTSMTAQQKEQARYPETVAGQKRREAGDMSFDEADGNRVNPTGGHYNCQTCVFAYEMRRRGYDVQAKNRKGDADEQQNSLAKDTTRGWIDPDTGKQPGLIRSETPLRNRIQAHKWLESSIKPGQRYFLEFCWKGSGAHIVTAERDASGELMIYDPQSGRIRKGQEITEYFGKIRVNSTTGGHWPPAILRVDHLLPRAEYSDTILSAKS